MDISGMKYLKQCKNNLKKKKKKRKKKYSQKYRNTEIGHKKKSKYLT